MAALWDELSQLRTAHEASRNTAPARRRARHHAGRAHPDPLLGFARRLRARLASLDCRTTDHRGHVHDLTGTSRTPAPGLRRAT
ncbi:hypothetical protein C2845_PM15G19900 [Panicum miliaceum]|uniref:Uncharacterized protein n=1 Tax=Panicum miliaceum TaxID=4540 RepID=A0A3L6Q3K0_PANMI|nr:hypothetical protein C2845_PM15G19900 [Panicum miliaceum]